MKSLKDCLNESLLVEAELNMKPKTNKDLNTSKTVIKKKITKNTILIVNILILN